jgi:alkylation response protein AidB-like acyl-CoA dehydrogenase
VSLAEALAADFAVRAAQHDRDGSYPFASIDELRAAGYLGAPVPAELGGLGVTSVHDVIVASSRLARGDASVAIGVNMHLATVLQLVRRRQMAVAQGNERRIAAFGASLQAIVTGGAVIATAVSELGQDLTRPSTVAARTDGGWRIDGQKAFCTMAPAATVLFTSVTFVDDDGRERYGYAQIPTDTPGVVIHDDWDALGMRASGTNTVTLDNVELPSAALRGGFPVGDAIAYMDRNITAGLFHAAASLGIAEAAEAAVRAPRAPDARARVLAAESAMDLGAARATLARAAALIDEHYAANPADVGADEAVTDLFAEAQAAKTFVNEAAARVVDRALALSGGAGYRNGHPLARAYRDVRAGAFMHPLGANRAYDFVGSVSLGLDHALH